MIQKEIKLLQISMGKNTVIQVTEYGSRVTITFKDDNSCHEVTMDYDTFMYLYGKIKTMKTILKHKERYKRKKNANRKTNPK